MGKPQSVNEVATLIFDGGSNCAYEQGIYRKWLTDRQANWIYGMFYREHGKKLNVFMGRIVDPDGNSIGTWELNRHDKFDRYTARLTVWLDRDKNRRPKPEMFTFEECRNRAVGWRNFVKEHKRDKNDEVWIPYIQKARDLSRAWAARARLAYRAGSSILVNSDFK